MDGTPRKKQPIAGKSILVSSGYGGNTRQPFIMIEMEELDRPLQLSPEEGRNLALNLLMASEAAEQDAFIFEFAKTGIGVSDEKAAAMLVVYRKYRANKWSEK